MKSLQYLKAKFKQLLASCHTWIDLLGDGFVTGVIPLNMKKGAVEISLYRLLGKGVKLENRATMSSLIHKKVFSCYIPHEPLRAWWLGARLREVKVGGCSLIAFGQILMFGIMHNLDICLCNLM